MQIADRLDAMPDLPEDVWEEIEGRIEAFESAWAGGEHPSIGDALADDPSDGQLLVELAHAELELRRKAGEPARAEEYLTAFPELATRPGVAESLRALEASLPEIQRSETASPGTETTREPEDRLRRPTGRPSRDAERDGLPVLPGYVFVREVGRGGMGVVYEARDLGLGRTVAVKTVPPGAEPSDRLRLRREAEAAAGLQHAHVVEVHQTLEHEGRLFVVSEHLTGGTLAERVGAAPLPAASAADVVATIARAVAYAHGRGIVHRDLKPANVLFTEDGTPKVADFGLAKRLGDAGDATRTGLIAGTPAYMAPEQVAGGGAVGPAADVWALGVILYELSTGRPPFRGPSAFETFELIRGVDPVPPRRLAPRLPRDLETVCLKCLQKDPNRRYASAAELADDLGRFRRGEPVRARPVGPVGRSARWARRNRAVAVLLTLLVGSLAGGAAVGFRQAARATAFAEAAEERERFGRRLLFASDMRLAAEAIRGGDAARANELLLEHADRTGGGLGFVRNHIGRMTRVTGRVIDGDFGGAVRHACLSPDGGMLTVGGEAGEVRFYQAGTWEPVGRWAAGQGELNGLAFGPDGKTLASAGDDGTIALWEVPAGREIWRVRHFEERAHGVAFGLGGRVVAACGKDRLVRLLDPASGREVAALAADGDPRHGSRGVEGLAVSPDGRILIAAGRTMPSAWDLESRSEIWRHEIVPAGNRFTSVACSPDGRYAAFGTPHAEVLVVAVATGERLHFGPFPSGRPTVKGDAHRHLAFPRPDLLAVGCDSGAIRLATVSARGVERPSGARRTAWQAHPDRIDFVGGFTDGAVVTGSRGGELSVWKPERAPAWRAASTGPRSPAAHEEGDLFRYGASAWVRTSRGDLLISARDDGVTAIDPDTGDTRHHPLGRGTRWYATSHPGGPRVFFLTGPTLAAWDFGGDEPTEVWRKESPFANGGKVGPGSTDGRVVAAMLSHNVPDVPTEYWVALFDAETGRMLRRRKLQGQACPPVLSADGNAVAISDGRTVLVLDPASLAVRRTLDGHGDSVQCVAFSPDGRRLASSGLDGRLILWNFESGVPIRDWRADVGHVWSLTFSPDGEVLASSTEGQPPRFWDIETGRLLLEPGPPPGEAAADGWNWRGAAFSADGSRVAAGGGRRVVIFDGRPLPSAAVEPE